MSQNPIQPNKYATSTRILHWLFIPFIIASIVSGKVMTAANFENPVSYYLPQYHYLSGLILLLLLLSRILSRLFNKTPKYSPALSLFNIVVAKSVQVLMLFTIFTVLVSGYLLATADGNPAKLPWGTWLIQLSPDDAFSLDLMLQIHTSALLVFAALLFLHIAGFIKQQLSNHSFIKRIF